VVRRVLSLLAELFGEQVLVTNNPADYEDLRPARAGLPALVLTEDHFKGRGPLGGLHAGLHAASRPAVFCVACDMPFLDRALITRQVECFLGGTPACEALVPRVGQLIEPLHAVYARSLAAAAERILAAADGGRSVRVLLEQARTAYWDLEDTAACRCAFFNINTPKDLAPLAARPGRGP